ncbi:MAG: hypothetical protein FD166_699 [Bacteroidetes bacterium]|nr:MAG: hypothetical protein FD166_699 [Bacteroidota bacterium]
MKSIADSRFCYVLDAGSRIGSSSPEGIVINKYMDIS